MKAIKIISILLILSLCFSFFGCKSEEPVDDVIPPASDSGEDTGDVSDTEDTDDTPDTEDTGDTEGEIDIPDEPKEEIFSDVAGKRIYLFSLTGVVMNAITEYSYDESGRLDTVKHLDSFALVSSETLANAVCKYTYSEDGKLSGYNYYGYPVELEYGEDGIARGVIEVAGNRLLIEFDFYESGRVKTETLRVDGSDGILVATYDEKGRIVSEADELSSVMSYSYGEHVVSVYTVEGELISNTEYRYNEDGSLGCALISGKNDIMVTNSWSYDDSLRCVECTYITDGLFQKTSFGYTDDYISSYQLLSGADEASLALVSSGEREKNSLGIVIYESSTLVENGVKTKSEARYYDDGSYCSYSEYSYHGNGNIETQVTEFYDREGYVTSEEGLNYDQSGALLKKMTVEYGDTTTKERVENYENGEMFSVYEIFSEYDENGDLIKETTDSYTEGVLVAKSVYECKYNEYGEITEERYLNYDGKGGFLFDEVVRYEYNENGEVVKTTVSTYDEKGNLIEITE